MSGEIIKSNTEAEVDSNSDDDDWSFCRYCNTHYKSIQVIIYTVNTVLMPGIFNSIPFIVLVCRICVLCMFSHQLFYV